jgi:hypothetical protein
MLFLVLTQQDPPPPNQPNCSADDGRCAFDSVQPTESVVQTHLPRVSCKFVFLVPALFIDHVTLRNCVRTFLLPPKFDQTRSNSIIYISQFSAFPYLLFKDG